MLHSRPSIVAAGQLIRVAALTLLLAGCAGDGEQRPGLARQMPSSSAPPPLSAPSPPTAPAATTTTASTPRPVAAASEVVLGPNGLGVVAFGTEAAVVLAELEARFGAPMDDRALGSCPSGEIDRLVQFAELSVLVATSAGTQRFVAWDLGPPSGVLPRLATAEGIGIGSTLSQLRAAYGGRLELSGDDPFGPGFEIAVETPGRLGGTLTGTSDDDTVTTLSGGSASCAL